MEITLKILTAVCCVLGFFATISKNRDVNKYSVGYYAMAILFQLN